MSEKNYLSLLHTTLYNGELLPNRTGVRAYTYPHYMLKFDMANGFPLLTTKKMAWKSIKVELEFFIKGLTDKRWLQERDCKIWNEWCNPNSIPKDLTPEQRKQFQYECTDLGKIYGYQWRNFNSSGKDQLLNIVEKLKTDPYNRQLVCSAWNPCEIDEQALPPCHVLWHVFTRRDKLDLCWFQRSCDLFLGVPFNIASYGLLLHLLSRETGYKEGTVTGFLSNCHIYENHKGAVLEQLNRVPYSFPRIYTKPFPSITDWSYSDTILIDYNHHDVIKASIAV